MQIAVCTPLYSIGTRRTAFTTHFQIIFQKTKRAPFLAKRRRSSKSSYETIGQIKKAAESNRHNYPYRIEHQSVHVIVWFRTVLGSSVIKTVSACSIRNRNIQFKQDFSCNFILTQCTFNVKNKFSILINFSHLHKSTRMFVRLLSECTKPSTSFQLVEVLFKV